MKKYLILILGLTVVILFSGCIGLGGAGSGNVVNETREVSDFQEVSLSGIGNLIISQGEQETLSIETDDNVLPYINSEVKNNRLEITYDPRMPAPTEGVNIYLNVVDINVVELSGAAKIEANQLNTDNLTLNMDGAGQANIDNITTEELFITNSGAGRITISGTTDQQTITINGAGEYRAADLVSRSATITINGSGNVILNVSEILNAIINGSGNVEYRGNPEVVEQISGIGSVRPIS